MPFGATVSARLFVLVILMIVTLGGSCVILLDDMRQYQRGVEKVQANHEQAQEIAIVLAELSTYRIRLGRYNSALFNDPDGHNAPEVAQAREDARQQLQSLLTALDQAESIRPELKDLVRIQLSGLEPLLERVMAAFRDRDDQALKQASTDFNRVLTASDSALKEAAERVRLETQSLYNAESTRATNAIKVVRASVISSILIAIVLSVWIVLSVTRPLKSILNAIQRLNEGLLTEQDLPPITSDEFGHVAKAMREFHATARKIQEAAYTDDLTGVGSRTKLEHDIKQHAKHDNDLGLVSINIDRMREINNNLGSHAGDEVLKEVSARLEAIKGENGLVYRPSGDRFMLLIWRKVSAAEFQKSVFELAQRVLHAIREPLPVAGQSIQLSGSIGFATESGQAADSDQLIIEAETAMYVSHDAGGSRITESDKALTKIARQRLSLIADIRRGLDAGEFITHYQPVIDVTSSKVVAVEALLRWQHRDGELLEPAHFLQAAVDSGMATPLGELSIREAHEYMTAWQEEHGLELDIGINLSASQVDNQSIVGVLDEISPSADELRRFSFELAESSLANRSSEAGLVCDALRERGCQIGIDNFGAELSSLWCLKRYPADFLKIGHEFVSNSENDKTVQAIIAAVCAMGDRMGVQIIGTGIETTTQATQLRHSGCVLHQGRMYAAPMPPDRLVQWVLRYQKRHARRVQATDDTGGHGGGKVRPIR